MTNRRFTYVLILIAACLVFTPVHGLGQSTPKNEKGVRYIYLIRHGEYDHEDKADSKTGKKLVELGHQQARFMGKRLKKLRLKFDTFVSSEYTRARETADDIGKSIKLTPTRDPLLNECTPASASDKKEPSEDDTAGCDQSLDAAWAKYMQTSPDRDLHDVLVCHGNVIRWFVSRALSGDGRLWRDMAIANASITVIAVRADGSTRVAAFSDTGHIPADKQTWTGDGAGWQPKAKTK
ncbi:MAG TPA: histidine phosphatase family protein [Pyrinomonadaceae bacterium]|nr:histidine phosphatase family protein [Pyrinomonadaceae bacterium]